MQTSYFANLKNVKNPLSICGKAPDWYLGPQFKMLAPKYSFFAQYKAGEIDEAEYTVQFKKQVLAQLNPQWVYKLIVSQYGDDVTLLCYEKPGDFCHRHIVSAWLSEHNGIHITELELPQKSIPGVVW